MPCFPHRARRLRLDYRNTFERSAGSSGTHHAKCEPRQTLDTFQDGGDGKRAYGTESVIETYYLLALGKHAALTADLQIVMDPGYKRDRRLVAIGPVALSNLPTSPTDASTRVPPILSDSVREIEPASMFRDR